MTVKRGLTRIVLIRSGGYDYAELELEHPTHLIAANNVGKTTLIAALQFLYIDDPRCMHFSKELSDTRRHYFPTTESAILFEAMTPTGFQVVGLRGKGPIHGYDFERFVFRGEYRRADFLDGRIVRLWADVSQDLMARDLAFLEPKQLRHSLLGAGDAKGAPPLALVPLRRPNSYENFRFLFRNLLRLSRIDQEHLKNLFIDITRNRLRLTEIDPRRDFSELYAQVNREKVEVEGLRKVAPNLDTLVQAYERRQSLRLQGIGRWKAIDQQFRLEQLRVSERQVTIDIELAGISDAIQACNDRESELGRLVNALSGEIALKKKEHERLDELAKSCRNFVEDLENATRSNLENERNNLIARIKKADPADRQQVEARIDELKGKLKLDEQFERRFASSFVNWLRQQERFTDSQIDDIFRILDPALLAGIVGPDEITIEDCAKLLQQLQQLLDCIDNAGFVAEGIFIHRQSLRADSAISKYQDLSAVRRRIIGMRKELGELDQTLVDIEERDRINRQIKELDNKLREAERRWKDWQDWQKLERGRTALATSLQQLEEERQTREQEKTDSSNDRISHANRRTTLKAEKERIESSLSRLADAIRALTPPPVEWETNATVLIESGALDDLIGQYKSLWNEQTGAAQKLERLMEVFDKQPLSRYKADTEAETISTLKDELAALADREHDVQQLWQGLVDGMKGQFKSLLDSLEELRKEVARLTRALSGRAISNLKKVELELVAQKDLVGRLDAVLAEDNLPLFIDVDTQNKARRKVIEWLEEGKRIEILELFDLHVKVTNYAGHTDTFHSLADIHSEGTSTTVKVLIHLELLRNLLSDDEVSIPFFLDEVGKLDVKNLRGLVEHATGMSFVPILASPEPRDCVQNLYFLQSSGAGIVLDETSRMILEMEAGDGA